MQLYPEMSSLQVANARGDGFLIIRLDAGRLRNRVVSREGWGTRTLWFDVDQDGRPKSPEWQEVDYEPRSRAWYVGLKDLPDQEVFWTEPYLFFTTKDMGITASVKWHDRGMEYVFAVDILLTSITDFTRAGHHPTHQKLPDRRSIPKTGAWWDCPVMKSCWIRSRFAGPCCSTSMRCRFRNCMPR